MTMNPLPPQAYTKDILLKAYQWLMGQNSSLKEMATTPDILVSLYLKATRDGDHALDRPSIQNFKKELRSLAGMMGELEGPPIPKAPVGASYTSPAMPASAPVTNASASSATSAPTVNAPLAQATRKSDLFEQLDSASRAMIHEVKDELNLSSEVEALRMLIKIGYSRSRSLLT